MWILPSVKSRMRGSDRSNRAQAAARRNSSGSLSDVLAVVVADDVAVLAQLHVRSSTVQGGGKRRASGLSIIALSLTRDCKPRKAKGATQT